MKNENTTNISKSFVDEKLKKFFEANGWGKTYDSFEPDRVSCGIKGVGMQKWEKWCFDAYDRGYLCQLFIHYEPDGKHTIYLYEGENENDCEEFKIRNIRSVLRRRGLAK